ncbi:hypothetical protein ACFYNO_17730 [Kitasatospora sp. NPDC006697]|uniref:hypothetical protein n=1 Tax=Kitasatospora sp. NPDC006697 TaxID=3364020 RepID=UPI0036B9B4B4
MTTVPHLPPRSPRSGAAAMYLRCYPYDQWHMSAHREAVHRFAGLRGVRDPLVFLDNGYRAGEPRPALRRLLHEIRHGRLDVVLVPGWFVFALDDAVAALIAGRITATGCRLWELPPRTA